MVIICQSIEDIRPGPIPSDLPNNLSLLFQFIGYNADGETNEFPWVGDKIIEWDHEGNEVWSRGTFDNFSKLDYDVIAELGPQRTMMEDLIGLMLMHFGFQRKIMQYIFFETLYLE